MDYTVKFFKYLCSAYDFQINGICADTYDFGHNADIGEFDEDREDYCCKNMQFIISEPKQDILEKYKITEDEFYIIAYDLQHNLSFGSCCLCS